MRIDYPKIFENLTVSVLAGGPSLKGFDFTRLRPPIVGVNNSAFIVDCDLAVSVDKKFIATYCDVLEALDCPFISNGRYNNYPKGTIIGHLEKQYEIDASVRQANLSGLFALIATITLGAKRVLLFGYDGGFKGEDSNYYQNPNPDVVSIMYEMQNERYELFNKYDILNIGLDSKIDAFPKLDLNSNFYN